MTVKRYNGSLSKTFFFLCGHRLIVIREILNENTDLINSGDHKKVWSLKNPTGDLDWEYLLSDLKLSKIYDEK